MNVSEGKDLYQEIQRTRVAIARDNPGMTASEAANAAYRKVALAAGITDAEYGDWKRDVTMAGMTSNDVAKNGKRDSDTYKSRYTALAMKHDVLPSDAILNDMWGCGDGTLSSLRAHMKREGYAFEDVDGGGKRVIMRPAPPVQKPPQPEQATLLTLPASQTDFAKDILNRLDTMIALLSDLYKAIQ